MLSRLQFFRKRTCLCQGRFISRKEMRKEKMSDSGDSVLHAMTGDLYGKVRSGLVVERQGDKLLVEDSFTRQVRECAQRSVLQKEHIVCGDRVNFQLVKASAAPDAQYQPQGLVVGRSARHNLLYRADPLHRAAEKIKVIAANVDQLLIVVAPVPRVPLETIDQLLVAGEAHGMKPVLVLNKCDMPEARGLEQRLDFYREVGYPLLLVSARSGRGLARLRQVLRGKSSSIFVGQSGVGKSSLINCLLQRAGEQEEELEVGELTRKGSSGAHTTTNSRLLRIPSLPPRVRGSSGDGESDEEVDEDDEEEEEEVKRGEEAEESEDEEDEGEEEEEVDDNEEEEAIVIDSPGIRELHLMHLSLPALLSAFPELEAAARSCRFRNCSHVSSEQGCAVQEGVREGTIAPSRLQSYFSFKQQLQGGEKIEDERHFED